MKAAELLIKIIKSVCEGVSLQAEDIVAARGCLDEVCELARRHDLEHFVDMGLHGKGVLREERKTVLHYDSVFRNYRRYQKTCAAQQKLFALLEQNKIDYLPLKGAVIRSWYPEPWMRTSCDVDILIRQDDLQKAERLLLQNGYEKKANGVHDISFKMEENLPLELHFNLLVENEKLDPLLSKVWQYAVLQQGHRYVMQNDYFFFYLLSHIAQHLLNGGCGIRPFLDLWIMKKTPIFAEEKVRALCESAGFGNLMTHILHLAGVWFGEERHTTVSRVLADFILEGGAYGNQNTLAQVRKGQTGGKLSFLWSRLFLSAKQLEVSLQVKKVTPWNYLYYSFRRILLIGRKEHRDVVKQQMRAYTSSLENQKVDELLKELELI